MNPMWSAVARRRGLPPGLVRACSSQSRDLYDVVRDRDCLGTVLACAGAQNTAFLAPWLVGNI